MKQEIYVEFDDNKTDISQLADTAKKIWKDGGNKMKDLETLELYFKPDELTCYYVINGDTNGYFKV